MAHFSIKSLFGDNSDSGNGHMKKDLTTQSYKIYLKDFTGGDIWNGNNKDEHFQNLVVYL